MTPASVLVRVPGSTSNVGAGFDCVGLRLIPATPQEVQHPMVGDTPLVRETERRLKDTGLRVLDVEIFRLRPDTVVANYEAALATGARLGGIRHALNALERITLTYRQRRIEFRVVWTKKMQGSGEYQVGLQALTSEPDAWGLSSSDFKARDVMPSAAQVAHASGTA